MEIDSGRIKKFCKKWKITELALFGSVLRDDFRGDSDVDVLVTFDPNNVPGFIRLYQIESELSVLMGGRRLDLITSKFLNYRIRELVLKDLEPLYAEE
ncbi:nucleotidyltransferase domain-containing protein [bacterium]|nr:nucleotidyltransferase domain-containing protein [bacterium]